MRSGSMGGGPPINAMGAGGFTGGRGAAMTGPQGRLARCKELAHQRGFNGGMKGRHVLGEFVKSCMQGTSF